MLPRNARLSLKREFNQLKKQAKVYSSRSFSLLLGPPNRRAGSAQFAFVVSKKIDRRAVSRNRVKRLLAASVQPLLPQIKPSLTVVFLAKKDIVTASQKELAQEIEAIFQKAAIFRSD
ncbi:ribonuclease P protein component [Candidatus Shapirobacteria bacterium CG10_big_fil_rev_8_21_14_0_10_48_15]|uniref:Ribonuclease P protein component n=1 Tax=Candidatus Shapirobacteria bacterium CG10_big_fil_rev_8_21_14_0_10_48_15 TaxID=1974484 RepID=A0A2M8L7G3_9BACT|nr:MAG: ribonuclease P protein component [Candidatus Shapirobacteria bacterium CG10_big_fil_rev_8_21_14_0_10_48_15]